MKAALGQLQLQWEDKEANLKLVETYMDLLAEKGTDLFLLPEMSLTGFSMHTDRTKECRESYGGHRDGENRKLLSERRLREDGTGRKGSGAGENEQGERHKCGKGGEEFSRVEQSRSEAVEGTAEEL